MDSSAAPSAIDESFFLANDDDALWGEIDEALFDEVVSEMTEESAQHISPSVDSAQTPTFHPTEVSSRPDDVSSSNSLQEPKRPKSIDAEDIDFPSLISEEDSPPGTLNFDFSLPEFPTQTDASTSLPLSTQQGHTNGFPAEETRPSFLAEQNSVPDQGLDNHDESFQVGHGFPDMDVAFDDLFDGDLPLSFDWENADARQEPLSASGNGSISNGVVGLPHQGTSIYEPVIEGGMPFLFDWENADAPLPASGVGNTSNAPVGLPYQETAVYEPVTDGGMLLPSDWENADAPLWTSGSGNTSNVPVGYPQQATSIYNPVPGPSDWHYDYSLTDMPGPSNPAHQMDQSTQEVDGNNTENDDESFSEGTPAETSLVPAKSATRFPIPLRRPAIVSSDLARRNTGYNRHRSYTALKQVPAPWHVFKYTMNGELSPTQLYTPAELTYFLFNHPLHHGKYSRDSPLALRIHRNPSKSRHRFPTTLSHRCRFSTCPSQHGTINQGHVCVAFDELSQTHPDHDPMLNAAYVHLYCLERFCNFPHICDNLNVMPERREFKKEPRGSNRMRFALEAEETTVDDFIESCRNGALSPDYPRYNRAWQHEGTLTHSLALVKLARERASTERQRIHREQEAGYTGATIANHVGDLEAEDEIRARTRTHRNQNRLVPQPKRNRRYFGDTEEDRGVDDIEEDEEYDDGPDERIFNTGEPMMSPGMEHRAPLAYMSSRAPNRAPINYGYPTAPAPGPAPQQRPRSDSNHSQTAPKPPKRRRKTYPVFGCTPQCPRGPHTHRVIHPNPNQGPTNNLDGQGMNNGTPFSPFVPVLLGEDPTPIAPQPADRHQRSSSPLPRERADVDEGSSDTDEETAAIRLERMELELKILENRERLAAKRNGKGKKRARENDEDEHGSSSRQKRLQM